VFPAAREGYDARPFSEITSDRQQRGSAFFAVANQRDPKIGHRLNLAALPSPSRLRCRLNCGIVNELQGGRHVMKRYLIIALLLLCLGPPLSTANATVITYQATVIDEAAGLWQYDYYLDEWTYGAFSGFIIFFPSDLYLLNYDFDHGVLPPAVNDDWDPLVFQPGYSGGPFEYDVMALTENPSLADPFSVEFTWLGTGSPGSQEFGIYDSSYDIVESGKVAPVPEPATLSLLIAGLGAFGVAARGRRKLKKT
jgi:hypothetical protein